MLCEAYLLQSKSMRARAGVCVFYMYRYILQVYLDDMEAGWLLTRNQFDSCDAAIFVGGGRQTTVVNNVSTNSYPQLATPG